MTITIFSVTGCVRCKIAKNFMSEQGISFVEKNMKEEGKEDFQAFYKANRNAIFRGPEGIEFPIIYDGENIRQSIGAVMAFLYHGKKLDGFFSVGTMHKEWVDGIHVSGGNPKYTEEFLEVLRFLKNNNFKLQVDTNGKNSSILKRILEENLADVLIMNVFGPEKLYGQLAGEEIDIEDVKRSLALIPEFPKFKIQTTIVPVTREDGTVNYLTPEEIGETAKFIEEGTGTKKNPYVIKAFNPKTSSNPAYKSLEPLENLFPYRSKARMYQVFTEIEN